MAQEGEISRLYREYVERLAALATAGDAMATRSLCCLRLLVMGWRYGDPDPPDDTPPDGGGAIIDLATYRQQQVAKPNEGTGDGAATSSARGRTASSGRGVAMQDVLGAGGR